MPGLVLALVLLPIARPLRAPDSRAWRTLIFLSVCLRGHRADHAALVRRLHRRHDLPHPGAGLGAGRARLAARRGEDRHRQDRRRGRRGRVCSRIVLGRAQEVQYAEHHYTRTTLFLQDGGPQKAFAFAHGQHDKRIGIAGSGEIFFGQYGYYGADLSNRVQYIGVPGPDGQYTLATSCREFRRQVNAGDYDYLIISQYTQDSLDSAYWYPIRAWTKDDPALELIIEEPEITPEPDYVYKVKGMLDPAGCAKIAGSKTKS